MGIATLWLLGTGMLWVMCWSGHKAYGQSVGLSLNGMTLPNNSIVTNTDIGIGATALLCITTSTSCCNSVNFEAQWYFPNETQVPNHPALPYQRTRGTNPGRIILSRNSESTTTGIFHCDIPDTSGVTQSLYVGIYDSGTGTPTATTLVYSDTTRSLTCTSTGGPATTVTWRKDGAVITINATYQQTQVVTDPVTGTYQTVLTIDQNVTDVSGTYSCTVGNTRETSAAIETTVSSLRVSITTGANPTAGESYTFTCTVTPQGGLTGTPTIQWRGPGSSDPITTGGDFTVSSTPPYTLTINPLRQSHDGQYTCLATIGTTTGSSSATLTVAAPSVSVVITPAGTAVVGQSYSLSCSVSGADSLNPTSITYRWYNESSNPRSQVGTTSTYSFTRLRPYYAGQYTCEVNIASPYLNEDLSRSMMQDITLQIPVPMVEIIPGVTSAYAGSQLTLTCSIVLGSTLFNVLGDLVVTSVWTGPSSGVLSNNSRVTVSPASQQGSSTIFLSRVMFNTLRTSDAGTYTCEATVAPRGSTAGTVTNGVESATGTTPTITNPTIVVNVISNTTRLPNMAPYNTFSLTCTATVPQGVVSPKTLTWRRRMGASTSGLNDVIVNSSILITSTNLDQPTSTSVLTVRETTAGDYRYRCRVDLTELGLPAVVTVMDLFPINIIGPANPMQPQNLMNISTRHDRTTVQWSVSYIAYTPETYTVRYGRAMNSLDMSVTATQRGDTFAIPSQPFMFSAELTGLDPGVTYYYQVEARNSVGPTLSAVQQFTSNELSSTPPRMFQITAVTTTSLSFSWQQPVNPNGAITGYQLSCQPLLLGIPTPELLSPGPTARMAVLAGLHPGVGYNCSIAAMNSAGPSDHVYADGTTTEIAPTGPPLNFMVTAGARNMTFSWAPPNASRNGVITGYSLVCAPQTGVGSITMQYTQAGTFMLQGFSPATTYICSIFASNIQGNGPVASMITSTLEDSPGAAPQGVVFGYDRDSPEMVFFSWQPPPPDQQNGVITRYDIFCTPSSGSGQPVNGMSTGALNVTVRMFTPATQYSCTITASTSAGTGPGNAVTVVTLPTAPDNITLISFSRLLVTWTTGPPNALISTYTIYVIRLEMGNATLTYTPTDSQFYIPSGDLDPYELVLVSVSASNSAGEGARSLPVRGRTREEPPGSVGCPSRWTDLTSTIQVNWMAPQKPNGIVLQYYLVLTRFSGNTVIASTTVNSNSTLTTDFTARLEDGVPYTVQIFAENSAGNGTVCNVTDFTNELEPPAPSGVSVTRISETVIRVMWQHLSLVEARGHIRYRVMVTSTTVNKRKRQATQGERMCTLMSPCEVPANESSVLVGGLDRDTSYSVTVLAVNSENEVGSTSAPLIATSVQPATGTSVVGIVVGIVVGFVVVIIIVVVIMGAVIGVLIARNKRYQLSIQEHAGKDQPVKWSAVAKSGDADITTTQCEAYGLADFGHEYEELPTSEMTSKPPNPEYEIPTAQCPAYIPTSQQKERVEEGEYETV